MLFQVCYFTYYTIKLIWLTNSIEIVSGIAPGLAKNSRFFYLHIPTAFCNFA